MKKQTQLLSALALSVGLSLSAPIQTMAAMPSQVPGQGASQPRADAGKVLPAVVSVQVEGTAVQGQKVPEELKKYFGDELPDSSRLSLLKGWVPGSLSMQQKATC
jgi:serine protease DegQ